MPAPHPTPPATDGTRLILASASPRRALILRDLGIPFEVHLPHCAEHAIDDDPVATVGENARQKALSVRKRYPGAAIIAADTVVAFQGQILGKPKDYAQAQAWLLSYAGKRQTVYTAVALMTPHALEPSLRIEVTSLRFKDYGALVAQEYLDRVQPFDRAGAYDINALGELLIAERVGSYTNVMGLPRDVVADWFNAHFKRSAR